jgi:hypothetical protein
MTVKRLPEISIASWVIFLGITIWAHVRITQQPPMWDAFTYYWKAYSFWHAVRQGHIFNPLNLKPTIRPPGSVVMAYPFGFDPDPRGFYFRSVFFPATLLILSVLVAASRRGHQTKEHWYLALTAIFFSTPPLLYWFAIIPNAPSPSVWGMVDGFLSGMAALAAAAAWRSVVQKSLTWTAIAAFLSSFCILIKPSGTLVAALIGAIWVFLMLIQYRATIDSNAAERATSRIRLVAGTLIIGAMDVAVLAIAITSNYLSEGNVAFGRASLAVLKVELKVPVSSLWGISRQGLGAPLILWMLLAITTVTIGYLSTRKRRDELGKAALYVGAAIAAIFAGLLGGWFWLIGSGGAQVIRYGMPFFMAAMVLMVPAVVHFRAAAPSLLTVATVVVMFIASANLALLLIHPNPGLAWQRWSGVSLSPGLPFSPMAQFQKFVDTPRTKWSYVYSFDVDEADGILESLSEQRFVFHPELASFYVRRPLDWQRPTTYRIDELLSSDYLLFRPVPKPAGDEIAFANIAADSFERERSLFVAWASGLTHLDGVDIIIDFPSARIVAVRDRNLLRKSLARMLLSHHWRMVFTDANRRALSELGEANPASLALTNGAAPLAANVSAVAKTILGSHINDVASPSPPGSCLGNVDGASSDGDEGGARVHGWAWSRRDKNAPNQILLVDDAGVIVGLASSGIERPDVVAAIPEIKDNRTGWQGYAKEARKVSAYALIAGGREACQLGGSFNSVPGAP